MHYTDFYVTRHSDDDFPEMTMRHKLNLVDYMFAQPTFCNLTAEGSITLAADDPIFNFIIGAKGSKFELILHNTYTRSYNRLLCTIYRYDAYPSSKENRVYFNYRNLTINDLIV